MPQPAFNRTLCRAAILALGWLLGPGACSCPGSDGVLDDAGYWARTWQTDDGLPRNTVISINQTPDGYLWLGTPFGVVRFDGITFTRMEGDFYAGFTRARSRVLYTDLHGRLWIGTGTAGIIRYDGNGFTIIDSHNGLPHPTVCTLCEDLRGTVWVGCQDGSVSWVDAEDQVHPVAPFRGERIAGAIQLVRDVQGTLWFAQGSAYGQLVEGAATNVTVVPGVAVVLCPGRRGGLWVSAGPTLQKLPSPESSQPVETFHSPVKPNEQPALFEDHAGNLWIGTPRGEVLRRSGQQFIPEFVSSHRVQSIFEDAEFNLWVGTEGGGVSRLQRRIFHTLTVREGLPQPVLRSVCEAANGDVWLSGQGPALLKWTAAGGLESVGGFTNIGTTCVLPRPDGGVWVGTVDWGLYSIEQGQPVRVGNGREFRNRQIRSIHQDAEGRLWVGCLPDGLAQLSDGEFTPPQRYADLGLPHDAIWSMADDAHGNLWLGTIDGELWRYDGTGFTHYGKADGLPGASIGALHFTPNGDLWIGTLGGGLGRMRHGRFVFADMRHGLADDAISSIVDDGLGFFWLSSDRGIVRVSRRDLDEFADGRRPRFRSIRYGKDDGLANMECLGGYQPSAWQTRSGAIWFATSKGAVVVNPAALPTNTSPPMPVLEKILLDDRDVTNRLNLKFAYGYGKLDFKFTAPSFSAPEQVHFRHQLVGLDADWIADGTARSASYPRLAPGKYVFRFTACNREGIWNERPVAIPFEVTPACWQTAWFRAAALLVFGGLVASGVRYRYAQKMRRKLRTLEQARAVEQERMRIARDIHDDLGARLTQMAFLSEMVADEVGEAGRAGERLVRLADSSRAAIRSLDEIVWAVNPRKDSLPDFVDYLSHYANEFFRPSNTRCRQNLPLMIPDLPLPTHFRHHLFLACKEALNNVSKHAQATEVWLKLNVTDGELEIIIEDNGRGFVTETTSLKGNGVANLNARLAAIGGRCRVESRPGHGTKVCLDVTLPAVPGNNPKPDGPAAAPSSSSA